MASSHPVAKYHVVELTLATRIRDGAYDAGGLPGERELAAEFGVARVTVRSALRRLADQGLVMRTERRGTAAVSTRDSARRVRLLRSHVDDFLDRGRRDKRKVLRFGEVAAPPAVAAALDLAEGAPVLRVVRLRSDSSSPLTYTEVFVPQRFAVGVTRALLNRKPFIHVLEQCGVKVGDAEQSIAAAGAPPPIATALGIAPSAPALRIRRLLRNDAGVAVQLLHGWYRADRFEFRMQLSRAADATRVWVEAR